MIRSIAFFFWLFLSLGIVGGLGLPSLLLPRKYAHRVFQIYIKSVRWGLRYIAGIKTEVRGRQNISPNASIIASKHQSMWETLLLNIVFDDLRIIMKRELMFYPIFGWYAYKLKQIPIDRGGTVRTLKKMTKDAKHVAEQGASILIFPEGTRTTPGAAPAYHRAGLTSLYGATGLAITPIATNSGQCWPAKGIRKFQGTIVYEILPQIPANLPKKEMMAQVETALETASTALLTENT